MKVWFDSFWGTFDKQDNLFTWILKELYPIEITPHNPDIVFTDSRNYNKVGSEIAVYFSGEPFFNINNCDYALTSFYVDDPRFLRLPLYLLYAYDLYKHGFTQSFDSIYIKNLSNILNQKDQFCAYISQGPGGANSPREAIVSTISKYKPITCAGRHLNNHPLIPGEPGAITGSMNKIAFLKSYKFALAIENNNCFDNYIGYTTEKIFEPMVANCVPIYWGNPLINRDFNEDSFLNLANFESLDHLLEKIIEIDSDQDLYIDYLMQPYIYSSKLFSKEYLCDLFKELTHDLS